MKHQISTSTETINGTCLQGYVEATYEQMVRAFGLPDNKDIDHDKVTNSWTITIDGLLCTIYDYKMNLNTGEIENWHIGGHAKACLQMVQESLDEVLNG